MPANEAAGEQHARVDARGRGGRPVAAPDGGAPTGVDAIIDDLRHIAATLPAQQPDPADGLVWAAYDAALSGLYGVIVALGEVQRLSRSAEAPSVPVERRVRPRAGAWREVPGRTAAVRRPPAIA